MASQTNQTIDQYGNVLETDEWDYTVGTFSATPTRKYLSTFATDSTHLGAYIQNLLMQTQLIAGGTTYTMVSNTYDSYGALYGSAMSSAVFRLTPSKSSMSSYRIVGLPSNSRAVRSGTAKLRGLLTGVHVMLTIV